MSEEGCCIIAEVLSTSMSLYNWNVEGMGKDETMERL